jgi:hypothetical protein
LSLFCENQPLISILKLKFYIKALPKLKSLKFSCATQFPNQFRWPKLIHILEHGNKDWLARVQCQLYVEQQVKSTIKLMTNQFSYDRQPTEDSMAVLNMKVPFEFMEDAILKIAYTKEK